MPIDVPAGRPGFVAALNAGVAASRGEIVCLTDDDAEPHADWISRILETFGRSRIGAVGGRDWVYHGGQLEEEQSCRSARSAGGAGSSAIIISGIGPRARWPY